MSDHIAIESVHHDGRKWLERCSCGWQQERWYSHNDDSPRTFEAHREGALKPAENACRYCFATIPWGRLFCAETCEKAARQRPDPDALAEALAAHREDIEPEGIVPGPDQGALW